RLDFGIPLLLVSGNFLQALFVQPGDVPVDELDVQIFHLNAAIRPLVRVLLGEGFHCVFPVHLRGGALEVVELRLIAFDIQTFIAILDFWWMNCIASRLLLARGIVMVML
ncbi:MAG: hypothetical protein AAGM22_12625, partial [Acidobacteriota bacterium]